MKALDDSPWKTRISEPKQKGFSRWRGDEAARRAVTNNRARLLPEVARQAFKLRAEIVERCFAHTLDRGGMRRTWLRGREKARRRLPTRQITVLNRPDNTFSKIKRIWSYHGGWPPSPAPMLNHITANL